MSTVNYTDTALQVKQALDGNDSIRLSGSVCCGNILMARGVYEVSSASVDDQIYIARLPKGAVVVPHLSKVISEGLGTTFSIKIGDDQVVDRYSSTMVLSTSGEASLAGGSGRFSPKETEFSDWVVATVTAVSSVSVGKKALFWIAYIMP